VIEVLKALRQTRSLIQLPVIMVTSSQRTDRIADALRAGANDYLTNRFDLTLALTRIHTQLLFTKANEEIRCREALLKCQIEASPDGILMVSSESSWLSYNLRFLELWGLTGEVSDEPTVQKGFDTLIERLSSPEQFRSILAALKRQPEERSWDELSLNDGRTFEAFSVPIRDLEKVHHGRIWYFRDVTSRKWAEDAQLETEIALRESEERYALAAKAANDGLWDWNLKTNEIYFSQRWKSILGCEEHEIGNNPEEWFKRVHPEDLERLNRSLADHLEGHSPHYQTEHRMIHRDGTYRWVLSRGMAVQDEDGVNSRIAGSQTDITGGKVSDALTGLPNRLLFIDRLEWAIKKSKRKKDYLFAVFFLDLDRFKLINDSLGHGIGDQFLVGIARKFQSCLRSTDAIARYEEKNMLARLGGD